MTLSFLHRAAAFALALVALAPGARADAPDGSAATLFDQVAERTMSGKSQEGLAYDHYFRGDGKAFLRSIQAGGAVLFDTGTWAVENDKLCRQWKRAVKGQRYCSGLAIEGDRFNDVYNNVRLMTAARSRPATRRG